MRRLLSHAVLVGALAGAGLVATGATSSGQSPPPPCPPGTPLLVLDSTNIDDGSAANSTVLAATHKIELEIGFSDTSPGEAAVDTKLTLTPPPGITLKVTPTGDPDEVDATFIAPPTPGTLTFTGNWNQETSPGSSDECSASGTFTVTTVAASPPKVHKLIPSVLHLPGHPGVANAFGVGWSFSLSYFRGDATPVTITAQVTTTGAAPTASTPGLTASFSPYGLTIPHPSVAKSSLMQVRFTDEGFDGATETNNYAGIVVFAARPPNGVGTARRGVSINLTEGTRSLAHLRFTTACKGRGHAFKCHPLP